jgi:hypothetical protein
MAEHEMPSKEQQLALVREAKERMIGRARSWLDDSKVKAAMQTCRPEDVEHRQAS